MKVEFDTADEVLKEFKNLANSPFYDKDKAVKVHAEAIVLKTMLEIRDLLIFIYREVSGEVEPSGRKPS
jgi:hypothetical protein